MIPKMIPRNHRLACAGVSCGTDEKKIKIQKWSDNSCISLSHTYNHNTNVHSVAIFYKYLCIVTISSATISTQQVDLYTCRYIQQYSITSKKKNQMYHIVKTTNRSWLKVWCNN